MRIKDIVLDFDGTCVTHEYPKVGKSIGAEPVLFKLLQNHCNLILFTMRSGGHLQDAVEWFKDRSIPLYGVQKNPSQSTWTESPKAYGQIYIDDAALGCPLIKPREGRPYVDWAAVEWKLTGEGVIKEGATRVDSSASLDRAKADKWWKGLSEDDKEYLFEARKILGWTAASKYNDLTTLEITALFKIYTNG